MFSNAAAYAAHGFAVVKTSTSVTSFMLQVRALFGAGTPREAAAAWNAFVIVIQAAEAIVVENIAAPKTRFLWGKIPMAG